MSSVSDIDCMSCLVNLARGIQEDLDLFIETPYLVHNNITHVAVYEMGCGRVSAACCYVPVLVGRTQIAWRFARGRP